MNINGHGLRDHLLLVAPLYGLIAAVWALRMIVAAAGAPRIVVLAVSVTIAQAFCILVVVVLIHVRRFGSYANVVFASFLLACWANVLVAAAIAFTALMGKVNIYSAPEFSGHMLTPMQHIVGHLTFGIGFGTIFGGAMGSLLLWMLRQLPGEARSQKR
ncbi:MAG: hypothetical protein ABSB82_17320 [Terriglobia bacterium]